MVHEPAVRCQHAQPHASLVRDLQGQELLTGASWPRMRLSARARPSFGSPEIAMARSPSKLHPAVQHPTTRTETSRWSRPVVAVVSRGDTVWTPDQEPSPKRAPAPAADSGGRRLSPTRVPALRRDPGVEVAGIEPASYDASPGLLRAQSALSLLDPTDLTNESV